MFYILTANKVERISSLQNAHVVAHFMTKIGNEKTITILDCQGNKIAKHTAKTITLYPQHSMIHKVAQKILRIF